MITAGQLTTPDDKKSRLVAGLLPLSRRAVIRDCTPNVARTYTDLTVAGSATPVDHQFVFSLPANCLRVLTVLSGNLSGVPVYNSEGRSVITRWRILTGQEIALDEEDASIEYIKDLATVDFDPLMDECLSHYLAWKMAIPLTESKSKRDEMEEAYALAKSLVKEADQSEGDRDIFADSPRLSNFRHGPSTGAW